MVSYDVCVCILDIQVAQPYPELYAVVVDPIRGLVDWKRSEEHLQSSNDSIKNKTKRFDIFFSITGGCSEGLGVV